MATITLDVDGLKLEDLTTCEVTLIGLRCHVVYSYRTPSTCKSVIYILTKHDYIQKNQITSFTVLLRVCKILISFLSLS